MIYKCFSPRLIINPYTKREMFTDCLDCEACFSRRSAELSGRIERECLANAGNDMYFVTLTYRNSDLPVYERCERDKDNKGYVWRSNRRGYGVILESDKANLNYYYPEKYPTKYAFGHLCQEDVMLFMGNYRSQMRHLFSERKCSVFLKRLEKYNEGCQCHRKRKNKGLDKKDIVCECPDYMKDPKELLEYEYFHKHFIKEGLTYNDVTFRYFVCGEYGGAFMRPHYHILFWFPRRYNAKQSSYILQRLRSCWKNGIVDIRPVTDSGIKGYLSSYVTSRIGLSGVYKDKSVRPFCTFSKAPVIGSYKVDYSEVRSVLFDGVNVRSHYDIEKGQIVDDIVSQSYWRRHFPKCSGFGYSSFDDKLRIYGYVFNYFKALGITHTVEDLDKISLKDIEFPIVMYSKVQHNAKMREHFKEEFDRLYPMDYDFYMMKGSKQYLSYGDLYEKFYQKYVIEREHINGFKEFQDYEGWSYLDRYASLVCYKYCVVFGVSPACVVDALISLYSRLELATLARFYAYQEERIKDNNHCDRFFWGKVCKLNL